MLKVRNLAWVTPEQRLWILVFKADAMNGEVLYSWSVVLRSLGRRPLRVRQVPFATLGLRGSLCLTLLSLVVTTVVIVRHGPMLLLGV